MKAQCEECSGSGECPIYDCDSGVLDFGEGDNCDDCGGSGLCADCNGEGTIEVSLPPVCNKVCNDCPWWRTSTPGWLGPMTAEEWIELARSDDPIACHQTIKVEEGQEAGDWNHPMMRQCAGAAIFRANICKSPRSPEVARLPSDREAIFATPAEFLAHHSR